MRKNSIIALIIVFVLGGLLWAQKIRAPKPAPPSANEIWKRDGVPVQTGLVKTGDMEASTEVTGTITALDQVTLSAKIPGRLSAVYVREGDRITAGQTIAMLDQDDAKQNLQSAQEGLRSAIARLSQAKTTAKVTKIQSDTGIEQAQASLKSAKSRLAVAKNPTRNQERMMAENRVAAAKANLDNKEADYTRYKQLLDKGAISSSTFDAYQTQYTVAQTDYKSALDQLSMIKEGGRNEDVDAAQAAVRVAEEQLRAAKANAAQNLLRAEDIKSAVAGVGQAQAGVELAKQQLSYTVVKSPISGQISSRVAEPGQVVNAGQAIASVVNVGSVYLKGDVSEKVVVNVAPGQHVRVKLDAMPEKEFNGTVAEVFPSGSDQNRNFSVRIAINDKNDLVKPGMFAKGEIVTGNHKNVLLVPKDAVDERSGSTMVFMVKGDGKYKKVTRYDVDVLSENSKYVEIASPNGLKPGDVLATAGRQNLNDGTKVLLKK